MRLGRWLVGLGAVTLGLAAAPALRADPPSPPSRSVPSGSASPADPKGPLQERVERLLERRGSSPSSRPSSLPAPSTLPAPSSSGPAWLPELSRRWAEVTRTRQARREKNRAALVHEVGARLQDPQVRAELGLHAQRVAELHRLEFLARNARSGEPRNRLLARIQKLQLREAKRHRLSMGKLAPPAGSAAPAPPGSTSTGR
jgi:hypothetical protein